MAYAKLRFLVLVKYNGDGWKRLVYQPDDRLEAVRPVVERCGGIIVRKDLVFQGDYDVVATMEFPSAEGAAAFYMAVMAGGAVSDMKVMRLVSIQEGIDVMKMAAGANYSFFPSSQPSRQPASQPATQVRRPGRAGRRRR